MSALIVYESMFGNTRMIAEAIREGLGSSGADAVISTAASAPVELGAYDLVIVGAPTHAHSLPRPTSRIDAGAWADDPGKHLRLEPGAHDPGVREWLKNITSAPDPGTRFAVFSTRVDIPRLFAGDAATAIVKRLRKRGIRVAERIDFVVDRDSHLVDGEAHRAQAWAERLLAAKVH